MMSRVFSIKDSKLRLLYPLKQGCKAKFMLKLPLRPSSTYRIFCPHSKVGATFTVFCASMFCAFRLSNSIKAQLLYKLFHSADEPSGETTGTEIQPVKLIHFREI